MSDEEYQLHISKTIARKHSSVKVDEKDNLRWIILPTDKSILKFDFLTCVLVFYDSFMIPFKITFETKHFGDVF